MSDSLPQDANQPVEVPPSRRAPAVFWSVTLLLLGAVAGLQLWNNRELLFHTKLYEAGDFASNSLFVREAKHGWLIHGHYSRWGFYHPGPAFLNTLAAGEALFFNLLHWVPTPFNGQMISLCVVSSAFFCAGVTIFARRLGPGRGGYLLFLPLALLFAIFHYSRVEGGVALIDGWPPSPPIPTFLCLVVSAAAVAAGYGDDLPVLVLAAGWLVHLHVAQPMFAVPITLLAYLGLLVSCRRRPGETAERRGLIGFLGTGWRRFPTAHRVALIFLALLVLPLAIDALHGRQSNLNRILTHVREYSGEPQKKFIRSLCYFLTFGGYDFYAAPDQVFGRYSAAGMLAYVRAHWVPYTFWVVALLGSPILFLAARRRETATASTVTAETPRRNVFIPWFYVILAAATALTLKWGMKMDGLMYYYNSFFNYSIFYALALALAAALSAFLMAWTNTAVGRRWRPVLALLLWLGVSGAAFERRDYFRLGNGFGTEEDHLLARTTDAAAATLPKDAICFLDCHPWGSWPVAIAMALELERQGHQFYVNDNWEVMFGVKRTIHQVDLSTPRPIVRWIVEPVSDDPARLSHTELGRGVALDWKAIPVLNPAGQRITFSKDGNFEDYAFFGWSPTQGDWTWSDERTALMEFRPQPLPDGDKSGVDMLVTAFSFAGPGSHATQRLEVQFNGEALTTVQLPELNVGTQTVRVPIDAARWQAAVARGVTRLSFAFPDAKSPKSVHMGGDTRLLGGAFREIEFRPADAKATP